MFNFLKLHKIHYVNGVLPDERPPEEKQKDWLTEEIMSPQPLKWITWEEWKKKPENIKMLNDIEVNNQGSVGSCFPGDALVLTEDFTYKKIKDLCIGDRVFTHKGRLMPVTHTFKRKWQGRMFQIQLYGDFRPIIATPEHPFWAIKRLPHQDIKNYTGIPNFYPIKELQKGDWVGMPFNNVVRDTSIYGIEKDPEFLWVLGLYLAEGSLDYHRKGDRVTFTLNSKEIDYYIRVKQTMEKYGASVTYVLSPERHTLNIRVTGSNGTKWGQLFRELGGEYCDKKQLDKRLMFLSPELQMNIVNGYYAGDGYKRKHNGKAIVSTSLPLLLQIKTILLRNKIYSSIYTKMQKNRKPAWIIEWSNNPRYSFIKDNWCFVQIKSIKKISAFMGGNVYNLEVQGDNSYQVQGVAVHNCASQAGSLALAINNYLEDGKFIKFSAKPIYARRRNKPRRGMYMDDLAKILTTYGTVPEVLYPSPNDTEENMSNLNGYISAFEAFGKILRAKNYFWLYNTRDIDSFARVLSLGKPIVLTVVFGDGEFGTSVPVVKPVQLKYGHAIVALQHAHFTYKGQKAILIQNSWGKNLFIGGRQILTADWFNKNRIICGIWLDDLDNLSVFNSQHLNKLPHYEFKKDLYVGCRGSDVAMLQTVLAMIKDDKGYLFPLWQGQAPTGYYGGVTRQAVKRFQIAHNITPTLGYFGPKTRTKLNKMLK